MLRIQVPAKVIFIGDHAVQHGVTAYATSMTSRHVTIEAVHDPFVDNATVPDEYYSIFDMVRTAMHQHHQGARCVARVLFL